MKLHDELLALAQELAVRPRPRQADRRRAVSTAYYALFHLLIDHACARLLPGKAKSLQPLLARAFVHSEMAKASKGFANANLKRHLSRHVAGAIPPDLQLVARAFHDLQQMRHEADYNVGRRFAEREVSDLVQQAAEAFTSWKRIGRSEAARVYLLDLLVHERVSKHT